MSIRQIREQDIADCVGVIRASFMTVAKQVIIIYLSTKMIANSEVFACYQITDTKGLERLCSKTP